MSQTQEKTESADEIVEKKVSGHYVDNQQDPCKCCMCWFLCCRNNESEYLIT